jgi:hypothetical protein
LSEFEPVQPLTLSAVLGAQVAPLLGIGCRSGDVVLGLSAVRRVRKLAFVLVSQTVSAGTVRQLMLLTRQGTKVYIVDAMEVIHQRLGRPDIAVIGIKPGALAQGVGKQLFTD